MDVAAIQCCQTVSKHAMGKVSLVSLEFKNDYMLFIPLKISRIILLQEIT